MTSLAQKEALRCLRSGYDRASAAPQADLRSESGSRLPVHRCPHPAQEGNALSQETEAQTAQGTRHEARGTTYSARAGAQAASHRHAGAQILAGAVLAETAFQLLQLRANRAPCGRPTSNLCEVGNARNDQADEEAQRKGPVQGAVVERVKYGLRQTAAVSPPVNPGTNGHV